MNPGRLDILVTVQVLTQSKDANGAVTSTWADLPLRIWASREDIGGREFRSGGALMAEADAVFVIRNNRSLSTHNRFVAEGVTYNLLSVQPVNRQGFQRVVARSITP